jgi:hypothetical protein
VPIREGAYLVHQRQHVPWSPDTLANEATERIAEVGTGAFAIVQLGAEPLDAGADERTVYP